MKLRLMTYNIHRAIGVDRRFRPDRIVSIAAHHQPDILLLQEVDQDAPRSQRLDLARIFAEELGYEHYAVGHNVTLRRGRYGNATLSRFPIAEERNIDLTIDRLKRRGCQFTTIAIPLTQDERPRSVRASGIPAKARFISIFNLHLGLIAQERARQIGVLARCHEYLRLAEDAPCIIGGDFNDWRLLLHPVFMDIMGFECATARAARFSGGLRTYPSFSPSGSLDRFYYRGVELSASRTCRLAASKVASDHLPVIADFVI